MKKLTKLLFGFSMIAVLMACMTAVSFAGTAEDKATVMYHAAEVGDFVSLTRSLEVQGDLAEKNFPEVAEYEPEGVSWLDALVADHIRLYGESDFKNHLAVAKSTYGDYAWVGKAYDQDLLASINDKTYVDSVHSTIKDEDNLTALLYNDGDYNKTFSYFDQPMYLATVYDPLTVDIKATSYGTDYPVDDAKIAIVDMTTGKFTEMDTEFKDGKATVQFTDPGNYLITAVGKVSYNSWGTDVTADYLGAVAFVQVADEVVVSFASGTPGSFDYYTELMLVNGNNVETYFPEYAENECEGISYADALIQAHIDKYGPDKVKDYLGMGESWGLIAMTKQFGHEFVGFYYLNDVATPVVPIQQPIKEFDDLFAGSYADYNYSDKYCYFGQTEVFTTPGKAVTLDLTIDPNGDTIKSSEVQLKQFDAETGAMSDLGDASYADGKATFTFDKTGIYCVSADGSVTYEPSWAAGTEVTGKIAGAKCKIYVEDAKPAKPVIKTAKRNSKTKGTVAWKKAKNAKKYEVAYKMKGAKKWTTKKTAKLKLTLKLKAKKAYQVKVRAINGSAKSAYSKVKTIKAK